MYPEATLQSVQPADFLLSHYSPISLTPFPQTEGTGSKKTHPVGGNIP